MIGGVALMRAAASSARLSIISGRAPFYLGDWRRVAGFRHEASIMPARLSRPSINKSCIRKPRLAVAAESLAASITIAYLRREALDDIDAWHALSSKMAGEVKRPRASCPAVA